MSTNPFSLGKLPPEQLDRWLSDLGGDDPRIILGPGIGLDCAVIDMGENFLVVKSDPITFTTEDIGTYAVQINANDIATTGAQPRWFLATLLLPVGSTPDSVAKIFQQLQAACATIGVTIVGGHTEVTTGIDRPILSGTIFGEVAKDSLITPRGASPGDTIFITKGVPIEAGSILAREFTEQLQVLDDSLIQRARNYISNPGISVLKDAAIAANSGGVTAMHDPTEGGILSGLWEIGVAADVGLVVDRQAIPILPEAAVLCETLGIDPLASLASGALLITVREAEKESLVVNMARAGIALTRIGTITKPGEMILEDEGRRTPLIRPDRDAVAALYERFGSNDESSQIRKNG